VLLAIGFVVAAGATALVVLSDDERMLRLAAVLALWAALIAAFAVTRSRRDAKTAALRESEAHLAYQVELQREVSARHEYEAELAAQMAAEQSSQIAELREQLDRLTEVLAALADGELLVSRMTLSAQSARFRTSQALAEAGSRAALGERAAYELQWAEQFGDGSVENGAVEDAEDVTEAETETRGQAEHAPQAGAEPEPAPGPERAAEPEPAAGPEPSAGPERAAGPETAAQASRPNQAAPSRVFVAGAGAVTPEQTSVPMPRPSRVSEREMPRVVAAPFVAPPTPVAPAAPLPEPAARVPEPAAPVAEPAARVPEPAAGVPEPAAGVPEPAVRHSRHAAPDADEPALLPGTDLPEAVAAQDIWAPPAPSEHGAQGPEAATETSPSDAVPTPPPAPEYTAPAPSSAPVPEPAAPWEPSPAGQPESEREPEPAPATSVDELLAAYGLTRSSRRRRRDQ
jgi:hypothetical protein